jgi:hypothetical protein
MHFESPIACIEVGHAMIGLGWQQHRPKAHNKIVKKQHQWHHTATHSTALNVPISQ